MMTVASASKDVGASTFNGSLMLLECGWKIDAAQQERYVQILSEQQKLGKTIPVRCDTHGKFGALFC